jgi:glutamate-1-semialdehyde 2,1-aminomutase
MTEPIMMSAGIIVPPPGYLRALREIADRHGVLLVFDEVITGFRLGLGGAQGRFGVRPDLTTLGKIIAGGMPIGAYGGRADLMGLVAPSGPVYQAGTLSGHPLSMAAGIATLGELTPGRYVALEETVSDLVVGLEAAAAAARCPVAIARVGPLVTVFFRPSVPADAAEALASDRAAYARFFGSMLDQGILLPPSQFEAWFPSMAHGPAEIDATIAAARVAFEASGA